MDFPSIPLLIAYNSQHFEPIEYNCVPRFFHTFEPNDPKVMINLDEFPLILESIVQQSPIQILRPNFLFYWNEYLDSTFIDILKNNWNLLLDYVVSIFNTSYNTSITKK